MYIKNICIKGLLLEEVYWHIQKILVNESTGTAQASNMWSYCIFSSLHSFLAQI